MSLPTITHPELNEDLLKAKGVSLVAFFDHVRKRKDTTSTVKLRLTFKRFPKYYTTKMSMDEKTYLLICSGSKGNNIKTKRIHIHEQLKKAYEIIIKMPEFSFEGFEKKFRNKQTSNNIFPYFDNYIKQLEEEGRVGTRLSYFYARKALSYFCKKEELSFDKITVDFLKKFEQSIVGNDGSPTTVGYHVRCFKKLYNDAIRDGNVKRENYPFGNKQNGLYSPPAPRNIKKALSSTDLKAIFSYQPTPGSSEHFYTDIWKFSYLSNGINMKDICLLKYKNIKDDNIQFNRAKLATTKRDGKPILISLIDENRQIIQRWGNKPELPESYIFPILTHGLTATQQQKKIKQLTKQVNKYMKKLAAKLEINSKISTYTARHSYATVLKRSGVNTAYISETLGHSNLKTTESYLDSFEDETRQVNTRKLLDF
ncbi:tyrosine-type recombinase/integrase [Sunxiuqinia sp. sy24]|uniref:tyrosine-type recombinase/integrase n=1 Tax=Sunxiuqinia sp. sy24 TaxID=3461495 RepID=UPI00404614E7